MWRQNQTLVLFTAAIDFGGGEQWVVDTARALQKIDRKVLVVADADNHYLGVALRNLNIPFRLYRDRSLHLFNTLVEVFRCFSPVHVIVNHVAGEIAEIPLFSIMRRVFPGLRVGFRFGMEIPLKIQKDPSVYAPLYGHGAEEEVEFMVFCCDYLRDHYESCFGIKRVRLSTVYNGVDEFPLVERNEPVLYAGIVGAVNSRKGINLLPDLGRILEDSRSLWRVRIYGSGEPKFVDRVKSNTRSDRVEFLGYEPDRRKIFGNIDLLLVLSQSEGLPNVVYEAMASGLPVVSFDVCGIPELVSNGENGFLLELNDLDGLPKCLEDLQVRDIRLRMGQAGRRKMRERFKRSDWVQRLVDEFDCPASTCFDGSAFQNFRGLLSAGNELWRDDDDAEADPAKYYRMVQMISTL